MVLTISPVRKKFTLAKTWHFRHNPTMLKGNEMRIIYEYGEIGLDEEASPGNGQFYCQHYASGYDACGFDTLAEAKYELEYYNTMWTKDAQ